MRSDIVITPLAQPVTDLTRARLRSTVKREIARGHVSHIVDLTGLTKLDVKTLSEIIRMRRWLREVGGFLHLIVDHPEVLKIFNVAGLDRIFELYPSQDAALADVGALAPIPA
jgi:anti-sigma B factor antagonist